MDGQPEGRDCGMQSSQWSPRKRCDIDNAKRWAQPPRAGRSESIIFVLHHAALPEPQSKKSFVPSAPTRVCWMMLLYVNHV